MGDIPDHPNLTPFEPGQSGNLKGRPKGRYKLSTLVQKALDSPSQIDPTKTVQEAWADALAAELEGDASGEAAKLVIAREWPATSKHEHSTPPGESLKLEHVPTAEKAAEALDILGEVGGADEA